MRGTLVLRIGLLAGLLISFIYSSSYAYWATHYLRGAEAPEGTQEWGLLERRILTVHGEINVASVSMAVFDVKPTDPVNEDAMAAQMVAMIPGLEWKKEIYKGVSIYTAYLKRDLRYFKMMVKDQGKKRVFTLANIHQPFILGTSLETEFLQRIFLKKHVDVAHGKKKTALWWDHLIPEAQGAWSANDLGRMLDAWVRSVAGSVGKERVESLIEAAGNIANRGVAAADRVTRGINRGADSIFQGAKSIDLLTAAGREVGNRLADTADVVSRRVSGDVDKVVGSFDKAVDKFTDPKLIRKLAAAAGLGFTLGSFAGTMLTNFVSEGAFKLLRESYFFLIKQEHSPEKRAELEARANDAMTSMDKAMAEINQLNIELGVLGMALTHVEGEPGMKWTEKFGMEQVLLQSENEDLKAKLKKLSGAEKNKCAIEIYRNKEQIFMFENMQSIVGQHDQRKSSPRDGICDRIYKALLSWRSAAAALNRAKNTVTTEMSTLLSQAQRRETESIDDPSSVSRRTSDCQSQAENRYKAEMKRFGQAGCENNLELQGCKALKERIEKIPSEGIVQCISAAKLKAEALSPVSVESSLAIANAGIGLAHERLANVVAMDCVEKDSRSFCKPGKEGDLVILERIYSAQFGKLKKKCPDVETSPNANPIYSIAEEKTGVPVEAARPLQASASPPSDSFFEKLTKQLKDWWSSIF